jgi:MerR family transcriptional regulator, light-induced transcriptional regulator
MTESSIGITRLHAHAISAPRRPVDAQLLARRYAATLLDGSPDLAERVLSDALDGGLDGPAVYARVVAPALHWIGDRWEEGDFCCADEHLAVSTTQRVVARMHARLFPVRIAPRGGRILLACVEGEQHRMGISLIADVLAAEGFQALDLGADLPTADLLYAIATHEPAVLCLSATMPASAAALRDAVQRVRASAPKLPLLLGGQAASPGLVAEPGAFVDDAEHAADCVRRVLATARAQTA